LRCGGTWAVGLDLLPNAADGAVAGVALPWEVLGLAPTPLHRAQLSAVWPGYPRPSPEESDSAFRFRLTRDAAHLDGLLPVGPMRQRMVKEPHGWILGLPLGTVTLSPLVVWEGSAEVLRAGLREALQDHPPEDWGAVDLTEAYAQARRAVFGTCRRVEVPVVAGEAVVMHRLCLHGVAPWAGSAVGPRVIAYFRPELASVEAWLLAP